MKKLALLSLFLLAGCEFLSAYEINFTTPEKSVVNPETDTIDLVVSQDALVYVSQVNCEGQSTMELLPVIKNGMEAKKSHNVTLEILKDVPAKSLCELEFTAFDESTTQTSRASLVVYVKEAPTPVVEPEVVPEETPVEEPEEETPSESTEPTDASTDTTPPSEESGV